MRPRFKRLYLFVFLLIFVLFPVVGYAVVLYPVGSSVKLAWDDEQVDIDYYEVVLIRDGTGAQYGPYTVTQKGIEIQRPKSGKYEVRVRAVRSGQYSEWHSSLDDNAILKTGVPGKWKVFFKLLGPSGPIIIY